jgi:polysaccharide export outer membrane protein
MRGNLGFRTALVMTLLFAWSCTHSGPYVWANRIPSRSAKETLIQVGDLVRVTVLRQEQLNVTTRVRPDGRIPLALVSDVEVAGVTPQGAADRIQVALVGFVVEPQVMVGVEERAPTRVAVLGQVTRPGMFDLDASQGVLHALSMAGGLTDLADDEQIFVLRTERDRTVRVRFTLEMLRRGEGSGQRFGFQPGDVLMVEQ